MQKITNLVNWSKIGSLARPLSVPFLFCASGIAGLDSLGQLCIVLQYIGPHQARGSMIMTQFLHQICFVTFLENKICQNYGQYSERGLRGACFFGMVKI